MDEVGKVRAYKYASDHRDTPVDKKIPNGYKLIGVKGFKNTYNGVVLHAADFIIWKPPPGWLDISPEGIAKRESARLDALHKHQMGMSGQSWRSSKLNKPKNFMKLNHQRIKKQQMAVWKQN